MSQSLAFARAAEIEATLERVAERVGDPTPQVYARLFGLYPQLQPHFWRDTNGAIKGEMLARTLAALLDFVGERLYADHMIGTEMVTHEGYDIPCEVFATFFAVVRDTVRDILDEDWTAPFETAWADLLVEIDPYVGVAPPTADGALEARNRDAPNPNPA